MAVQPTSRSTFASTIWNSPAKARHSTNAAKFGGPNVNINEGSKVQFGDGDTVWDVARVFEDGTLFLTANSSGRKMTRRIPPSSPSWSNLWIVDGRRLPSVKSKTQETRPKGGGPNRNIHPGNVVTLGTSLVRWSVVTVARDGSLGLQAYNGERLLSATVGPLSKLWNSIYPVMR